jgi:heme/copper-type cytochrome/quinol oxidase subunit 4
VSRHRPPRVATVGRAFSVLSVIVGLATMVFGGYLAAWMRPAAATVLAAIVILVIVVSFVTMRDSAPLWYGLAFLIFGPVAALAGGTLCRVRRTGRHSA